MGPTAHEGLPAGRPPGHDRPRFLPRIQPGPEARIAGQPVELSGQEAELGGMDPPDGGQQSHAGVNRVLGLPVGHRQPNSG